MAERKQALKAPTLGKQAKSDLPAALFSEQFHESLVHEAARADLAARRRGTASTLGRGSHWSLRASAAPRLSAPRGAL